MVNSKKVWVLIDFTDSPLRVSLISQKALLESYDIEPEQWRRMKKEGWRIEPMYLTKKKPK